VGIRKLPFQIYVRGILAQDGVLISKPPAGKCKITNIYIDPETEKTVIEYDDIPVEE
jgi:hypothetical protein